MQNECEYLCTGCRSISLQVHPCSSAVFCAGHADFKAIIDQEIAQEIARLEAKIDAVISKCFMLDFVSYKYSNVGWVPVSYDLQNVHVDKRLLGRQVSANDNPELRLEDLSRQIAQLRKGQHPLSFVYML